MFVVAWKQVFPPLDLLLRLQCCGTRAKDSVLAGPQYHNGEQRSQFHLRLHSGLHLWLHSGLRSGSTPIRAQSGMGTTDPFSTSGKK